LDESLLTYQTEKQQLDSRALDASLYEAQNKQELQQHLKRQAELTALIEAAELKWLELHEALEALPEID